MLSQLLTPADQLRLMEELAAQVRGQVTLQPRRSILDLQGMGKEIWLGMDAQEYVCMVINVNTAKVPLNNV
ncbi:hypothetical protein M1O53_02785 [Dehalococcoidia bacterium]|nr:hypothetical protein [Dehalococcoidia bacterium]MCL0080486.1 hypothetical protein [Dehalococcoidia bacterium]MCL0087845.1 hypothetical protein [Dehalococcoidia bacterium]MCL0089961.1 hypothetical protein [Dehalococcoidia bacterium]MCL0093889.1 hypothetical protein [Dehalococcoidia bacterium]